MAACTSASKAQPGGDAAEPALGAPAGLTDFCEQQLDWSTCGEATECPRLDGALDHDDPAAQRIRLTVDGSATELSTGAPAPRR